MRLGKIISGFLLLFSVNLQAAEDITDSFINSFSDIAIGSSASVGWEKIEDGCLAKVGGQCLTRRVIKARGSLRVSSFERSEGKIMRQSITNPLTGVTGESMFFSDLYVQLRYEGTARSERFENNVLIDKPWGHSHPTGTIHLWLKASTETGYSLTLEFVADPGHDDGPNHFIAGRVASGVKPVLADKIRNILGLRTIEWVN